MDILQWLIAMLMIASFRNGVNTELIPQDLQKEYIEEYVMEIIAEGDYDIHPAFILAIIERESGYKWQAQNGVHTGLMQINPQYQKVRMEKLGVEDLGACAYDNIKVGVDYVDALFDMYPGSPIDVLNCYNSGSTDGFAHEYSIDVLDRYYRIQHEMWDKYEGW